MAKIIIIEVSNELYRKTENEMIRIFNDAQCKEVVTTKHVIQHLLTKEGAFDKLKISIAVDALSL